MVKIQIINMPVQKHQATSQKWKVQASITRRRTTGPNSSNQFFVQVFIVHCHINHVKVVIRVELEHLTRVSTPIYRPCEKLLLSKNSQVFQPVSPQVKMGPTWNDIVIPHMKNATNAFIYFRVNDQKEF